MSSYIIAYILTVLDILILFYVWSLLAYVGMGWLIQFRIIHPYQPGVYQIFKMLASMHEPILRPIRNVLNSILPNMGGIDFSPLVALLVANLLVGELAQRVLVLLAATFF